MKSLHDLHPNPKARHKRKRVGRGESSGHGKTSGRGGKGQTARSGHKRKSQFEGGQMSLVRRLPKFGFVSLNAARRDLVAINLDDLKAFSGKTEVSIKALVEKGLIPSSTRVLRILGKGKLEHPLTIKASYFTKGALEKINAAQGKAEVV